MRRRGRPPLRARRPLDTQSINSGEAKWGRCKRGWSGMFIAITVLYTCIYINLSLSLYIYIYIYIHLYLSLFLSTYIYIYICIYI